MGRHDYLLTLLRKRGDAYMFVLYVEHRKCKQQSYSNARTVQRVTRTLISPYIAHLLPGFGFRTDPAANLV